jgi:hypothetical protein
VARAAPAGAGRGGPGPGVARVAAQGGLAVRMEAMRESEAGERNSGAVCSLPLFQLNLWAFHSYIVPSITISMALDPTQK